MNSSVGQKTGATGRAMARRPQKSCAHCGDSYRPRVPWQRVCGPSCRAAAWLPPSPPHPPAPVEEDPTPLTPPRVEALSTTPPRPSAPPPRPPQVPQPRSRPPETEFVIKPAVERRSGGVPTDGTPRRPTRRNCLWCARVVVVDQYGDERDPPVYCKPHCRDLVAVYEQRIEWMKARRWDLLGNPKPPKLSLADRRPRALPWLVPAESPPRNQKQALAAIVAARKSF